MLCRQINSESESFRTEPFVGANQEVSIRDVAGITSNVVSYQGFPLEIAHPGHEERSAAEVSTGDFVIRDCEYGLSRHTQGDISEGGSRMKTPRLSPILYARKQDVIVCY